MFMNQKKEREYMRCPDLSSTESIKRSDSWRKRPVCCLNSVLNIYLFVLFTVIILILTTYYWRVYKKKADGTSAGLNERIKSEIELSDLASTGRSVATDLIITNFDTVEITSTVSNNDSVISEPSKIEIGISEKKAIDSFSNNNIFNESALNISDTNESIEHLYLELNSTFPFFNASTHQRTFSAVTNVSLVEIKVTNYFNTPTESTNEINQSTDSTNEINTSTVSTNEFTTSTEIIKKLTASTKENGKKATNNPVTTEFTKYLEETTEPLKKLSKTTSKTLDLVTKNEEKMNIGNGLLEHEIKVQSVTTIKDITTSLKMKYSSTEFFSKNSTLYSYCEEIDYPCENGHICSSASNLNDSVKSYSCNCSKGFASDDKTCENCKFILVLFLY